jgi:hypothetical protein
MVHGELLWSRVSLTGLPVLGLYRLTMAKEVPKSPQGEWPEKDKVSEKPLPLLQNPSPLCLSCCLVMGGDGQKSE